MSNSMVISSLLRVHPRFLRSVHLERDIQDPTSSLGYIPTAVAEQALDRIVSGFSAKSTQRAWRIAGDFGSGKTGLALVLARAARGSANELPQQLRRFAVRRGAYIPAMATGDSEPLSATVLRALGVKGSAGGTHSTPNDVLRAVRDAVTRAQRRKRLGLLLILDELGKNLEYAARHPESDDVFLLQRLAEEAARSGDRPFVVVVMLHQGVAAYTSSLDSAARREWEKVAGRFEEIVYAQPTEQVAELVAATLNVDTRRLPEALRKESHVAMVGALRAGMYGASAPKSLQELGPRIFPIHPTALPVLVRSMRRFGQNERSLFSFISSAEPLGLQHHAAQFAEVAGHFRVAHLFDYIRLNLLHGSAGGAAQIHWGVVEAVLSSVSIETPEQEAILKTVAMLSLLDAPDLPATEEVVRASVRGAAKDIDSALKSLRARQIIYERGAAKALCLWPHTSVSLDEAFERGTQATAATSGGVKRLCEQVRSEHLVPRAYFANTGTLRYAAVSLIPASDVGALFTEPPQLDGKGADLSVRIVVPADSAQQRAARQILQTKATTLAEGLYVAVTDPARDAVSALADLTAWEWVGRNTPELTGDRYAREEVSRQIGQARRNLGARLGGLDNLAVPTARRLEWFHRAAASPTVLAAGRELLTFLGMECERIYSKAPKVLNELLNRRVPSSAAVAARTKLAQAMATAPDQEKLGMDDNKRPAEMALYLSILDHGGFHTRGRSGWMFRMPSPQQDKCNLLPCLHLITETLKGKGTDALVEVPEVFRALALPPFGVRDGLQPLVLALYLATHHQRVALYEDLSYLHQVGGDVFLRLMKEPQFFHLQYCEIKGIRADVFTRLLALLKFRPRDPNKSDLLDLVRPLAVFISQEVPEFCRKTSSMPAAAVAVRQALLDAREPVRLVFTTLPEACGFAPIGKDGLKRPDDLAARLRSALHEIRTAYPKLIGRLRTAIFAAFDVAGSAGSGRKLIAERAAQLAVGVTEPTLKAFAVRLGDTALDDRRWVESVANFLARKSPERWLDSDETEFHHQLAIAAGRFKRTELVVIGTTKRLNGHACRIALTKSDGSEVGDLVDWEGMDEARIRPLEGEIGQLLARHGRHGLAAAMRALWTQLNLHQPERKEGVKP